MIDPKRKFQFFLFVITALVLGIAIGAGICYYNTCQDIKAKSEQNIANLQNLVFLEKNKERIKNIEEIIKKENGNKKFEPDELEYIIAEQLVEDIEQMGTENNFDDVLALLDTIKSFLLIQPSIEKLVNEKEKKIKQKDEQLNKKTGKSEEEISALEKEIENIYRLIEKEFISKLLDTTIRTIGFYNNLSIYSSSFVYLLHYFVVKFYDIKQKPVKNDLTYEKQLEDLLKNDELGRLFKINLFAESSKHLKQTFQYNISITVLSDFFDCFGDQSFIQEFLDHLELLINETDRKYADK